MSHICQQKTVLLLFDISIEVSQVTNYMFLYSDYVIDPKTIITDWCVSFLCKIINNKQFLLAKKASICQKHKSCLNKNFTKNARFYKNVQFILCSEVSRYY